MSLFVVMISPAGLYAKLLALQSAASSSGELKISWSYLSWLWLALYILATSCKAAGTVALL